MRQFLAFFAIPIYLLGCAKTIYPPTKNYAGFVIGDTSLQIRISPYENVMPGSRSENIIIPINFNANNREGWTDWPRKFRIIKIDIPGVKDKFTRLDKLDHNEWMHNTDMEFSSNALRVPKEEIGYAFNMSIRFKDDRGKRYLVRFYSCQVGQVN